MRRLLLSLLGGVPVEDHVAWTEHHMAASGKVQGELRQRRDALHADLARVEQERDVASRQAAWWKMVADQYCIAGDAVEPYLRWLETGEGEEPLTPLQEAEKRIADLEAKLAEATRKGSSEQ